MFMTFLNLMLIIFCKLRVESGSESESFQNILDPDGSWSATLLNIVHIGDNEFVAILGESIYEKYNTRQEDVLCYHH